jgi:hypothetical protein
MEEKKVIEEPLLLSCPFCGGEVMQNTSSSIDCESCGLLAMWVDCGTYEGRALVKKWNSREMGDYKCQI